MATKTSAEVLENGKNFVRVLQESVAGTEESEKASRDRVEMALMVLQELLDTAEETSRKSKETAEAAIKVSREAIYRLNEICRATEETAKKARSTLEEAIGIAQAKSDSIIDTTWALSKAAKEAIETPEREAKAKWWNG